MTSNRARASATATVLVIVAAVTVYAYVSARSNVQPQSTTTQWAAEDTQSTALPAAAQGTVDVGSAIPVTGTRGVIRVTAEGACLDASADKGPEMCFNLVDGNFDLAANVALQQAAGWGGTTVVYGAIRNDVESVNVTSAEGRSLESQIYAPTGANWKLFIATGTSVPFVIREGGPNHPPYKVVAKGVDGNVLLSIEK